MESERKGNKRKRGMEIKENEREEKDKWAEREGKRGIPERET